MPDVLAFAEPWRDLRASAPGAADADPEAAARRQAEAERLAHELVAEIKPGHPLHGQPTQVVASFEKRNDIMVARPDGFAIVHLTWRGEAERPPWPLVVFYHSVAAAQAAVDDDR